MNRDQIQGKWSEIKGEVKRQWGELTDDDFKYAEGDLEKLWGRVQQRYGEKKEGLRAEFDRLIERISPKKDAA